MIFLCFSIYTIYFFASGLQSVQRMDGIGTRVQSVILESTKDQ